MKKTNHHKYSSNIGEISSFINSDSQESIATDLLDKLSIAVRSFNLASRLACFNIYKKRGFKIADLLKDLLILPFLGCTSVCDFKSKDFGISGKDAYYDVKRNSNLDWRSLLYNIAKQFVNKHNSEDIEEASDGVTAFIGDDSTLAKTTHKSELVSKVYDHSSCRYVFGYKILTIGFWDKAHLIPLDFSIHRERGSAYDKAKKKLVTLTKRSKKVDKHIKILVERLKLKTEQKNKCKEKLDKNFTATNNRRYESSIVQVHKVQMAINTKRDELKSLKAEIKLKGLEMIDISSSNPTYGLTKKKKKEQFKKKRNKNSFGYKRAKESTKKKSDMFISMIKRAISKGFKADYVITDSWFFSHTLLEFVESIKGKGINLISMAKINAATKYIIIDNGKEKEMCAIEAVERYQEKSKYCRKYKAHYIQKQAKYKGIRVQIFMIKMGANWRMIVTNDISMTFIKAMQVYSIRWTIEVMFKETKQFLRLGKSQSQDFDALIADTSFTFIQHILITSLKRQQRQISFGGIFKEISHLMVESIIITKIIKCIVALIQRDIAEIIAIDIIKTIRTMFNRTATLETIEELIFEQNKGTDKVQYI